MSPTGSGSTDSNTSTPRDDPKGPTTMHASPARDPQSGAVSRRLVLGGFLGAAFSSLALASCSDGGGSGGNGDGSQGTGWTPPAYIPFDGVTPDLPGSDIGVAPAFFSYPQNPIPREGFPLPQTDGVTALLQGGVPPTAPDQNEAYRLFREQAGNLMEAVTINADEYRSRFQVVIAGGDIPDFMQMLTVPQLPQLLEAEFSDLTDILGGDAVAAYPGLANIPTPSWTIPKVNGRLWGIPQPRPPAGRILSTRGDIFEEKRLDPYPDLNSGEDFIELLATLTDRGNDQFALGTDPVSWLLNGLLEMMEAPNTWAVEGGTFTHMFNSPQMVEALNEGKKIIDAGYLHPNSFSDPGQHNTWWRAGTTCMLWQSFAGWGTFARSEPSWNIGYVRLPKWGGGGKAPLWKLQAGYPAFVAIKKQTSDARLEELLRIADFIASPFGTEQFLTVNYGAEGFTYERQDGQPEFLPDQRPNTVQGWQYCGANANAVLYAPGQDEMVRRQHAYLEEVIPAGTENPTLGLYSETAVTAGASWEQRTGDMLREVLRGAQPVSAWETMASDWKADVGDKMAAEYGEAATAG
ncbi:hypothetical protein OCAE111667_21175 [Occultella aeris]|uniref:Uncharacterized protein n=1 Tax=Occultella aeris TaxID=2761496 RepID=A0A7M4DQR7_9MICO|nr:hypothetical protein [Occultella aeris]VZO39811.1 hypothetical protein HALOF300_04508 [Occultella aeris]